MNTFIDTYGVLDKHYTGSDTEEPGWVLSKAKKMSKYDGRYMVVMEQGPPALSATVDTTP